MNKPSDSIVLAEQQVAEARTAALAEYQMEQLKLRRVSSPALIGGAFLGAIAVGYLALSHQKPKRLAYRGSPRAWTGVLKTVQVLMPLLKKVNSPSKTLSGPASASAK